MIVNEINKPLVGQETFKYVNTVKMMNDKNWVDNKHKLTMQNIMMNNGKKDYIGYDTNEMAGFSDNFAYTKTDNAQPHSYVQLDAKTSSIFTAPKDNKKLSKEEQNRAIKEIQEKRDKQDDFYKTEMEKDQQHKVYISKLKDSMPEHVKKQMEQKEDMMKQLQVGNVADNMQQQHNQQQHNQQQHNQQQHNQQIPQVPQVQQQIPQVPQVQQQNMQQHQQQQQQAMLQQQMQQQMRRGGMNSMGRLQQTQQMQNAQRMNQMRQNANNMRRMSGQPNGNMMNNANNIMHMQQMQNGMRSKFENTMSSTNRGQLRK
jgi:hypothetical protein